MHGLRTPHIDQPPLLRYGFPFLTTETAPAAGASFTTSVVGNYQERLLTVWVRLVTDGNAANREVVLEFQDGSGNTYAMCGAATTVPASSTYDYSFSVWQGTDTFPVNTGILVPLAPIIQLPTYKWKLTVVNVQATDALSRIRVYKERFFSDSEIPGRDYGTDYQG